MCIDSGSVKYQDLSPYRDFLEWNGKEQHRSSCQSCEALPPVIINPYPITPDQRENYFVKILEGM